MTDDKRILLSCLKATLDILYNPQKEVVIENMFMEGELEKFKKSVETTIKELEIDKNIPFDLKA